MTKNTDLSRTKTGLKSRRKPLKDVSNAKNTCKSNIICKKTTPENRGEVGDDSLDRLLLVHSDLSSILHQVDELVIQALQVKSVKGLFEIKLFADALSEMQNSLKAWVQRLQKVLSSQLTEPENKTKQPDETKKVLLPEASTNALTESPEPTKSELLISPSPLVSWRAGRYTQGVRRLFILTPLPQKMKTHTLTCRASEKIKSEKTVGQEFLYDPTRKLGDDFSETVVVTKLHTNNGLGAESSKSVHNVEPNHDSVDLVSEASMFLMTPGTKMSPPKSCILLEPVSFSKKKNPGALRSTPFPGFKPIESRDSDSSNSQDSDDLGPTYPELSDVKLIPGLGHRVKILEDSLDWIVSPPKTCAILDFTDEPMPADNASDCSPPQTIAMHSNEGGLTSIKKDDCQGFDATSSKLCHNQGLSNIIEITPVVKGPASSFLRGKKHPGENTLKKELWTKFEVASSHAIRLNDSILQKTAPKEFLDLLNEACDA